MKKNINCLILVMLALVNLQAQQPTLDATFNAVGFNTVAVGAFYHDVRSVHQQSDGKIVSAFTGGAGSLNYKFYTIRYLSNGTIDNSYGINGVTTVSIGTQTSELNNAAIQSDDKIVAVGWTKNTTGPITMAIARLNTNGTLDNTFNTSGKLALAFSTFTNSQAYAMAAHIQADGKILVAGISIDTVNFTQRLLAIARLNSNGSLDNSFATNGKFLLDLTTGYDEINGITTDGNGNIYATATRSIGTAVLKLNSNGNLVTAFGASGIATYASMGSAATIFVNTPGTQINAGNFQLTAIGGLDNNFGSGGIVSNFPSVTFKQADGKILGVTNTFTLASNFFALHRLNTNGSYDNTFGINGIYTTTLINQATNCINMQLDGKILVGGGNTTARLNNNLSTFVNETLNNKGFRAFPNPANEQITISLNTSEDWSLTVILTNLLGEETIYETITKANSTLKTSHLKSGVYFLTLIAQNKKLTQKIIIN
jgi:uncharacterized delta-60 repeat protein